MTSPNATAAARATSRRVIDAAVLGALARTLDGPTQEVSRTHALRELARVDPLLRTRARHRLREAIADAEVITSLKRGTDAEAHALRLTYLLLAGTVPARAMRDDVDAIEHLYLSTRSTQSPEPRPFWWRSAALVLGVVGAVALAVGFARRPASTADVAPIASDAGSPSPGAHMAGAFKSGGVPAKTAHDAAIARAFSTDLPTFLIALDARFEARTGQQKDRERVEADAEKTMKDARAKGLDDEVKEALGAEAFAALDALFTAAETASSSGSSNDQQQADELGRAAGKLDEALAAAGIGYFVDADLIEQDGGRRLVLVYSFRVVDVSVYAAGATEVRALRLRRIDHLNWTHTLLGFTRPAITFAAVLLDQLDDQVLSLVGPALAEGAPMTLFEPEATTEERATVEARAGELTRAEIAAVPGLDARAVATLGKLLAERAAVLARMEKLATKRGATLVIPRRLHLPESFASELKGWVPEDDLKAMLRIDRSLEDKTREDAFAGLRDAIAPSIERHEVQHRLDALGPTPPPHPRELVALVGPLVSKSGKEQRGAMAARAELSAYLSELAREERLPRLALTMITRFLFDKRMHGSPECYAALVVLEGLAPLIREGSADAARPMLANGKIDRRAVSAVWTGLVALPPEKLREEAKALWERLFGMPLGPLVRLAK